MKLFVSNSLLFLVTCSIARKGYKCSLCFLLLLLLFRCNIYASDCTLYTIHHRHISNNLDRFHFNFVVGAIFFCRLDRWNFRIDQRLAKNKEALTWQWHVQLRLFNSVHRMCTKKEPDFASL